MAVLQSTNVQGSLCVNGVAVGGGKDFYFCCFTTSGNFTPSQDLVDGNGGTETTLIGAGGGGGAGYANCAISFGGGGGGGEVNHNAFKVTSTSACCYVIGAGGTGGTICCGCSTAGNANICQVATAGGNTCLFGTCAYGGGAGATTAVNCDNNYCGGSFNQRCIGNISGGPVGGFGVNLAQNFGPTNMQANVATGMGQGGNRSDRFPFGSMSNYSCNFIFPCYDPNLCDATYKTGTDKESIVRIGRAGSGWQGYAGGGGTGWKISTPGVDGGGCGEMCCSNCIPNGATITAGDATSCGGGGGGASTCSRCRNGGVVSGGDGANGLIILKWQQ